jgi:ankyrin repeat protein
MRRAGAMAMPLAAICVALMRAPAAWAGDSAPEFARFAPAAPAEAPASPTAPTAPPAPQRRLPADSFGPATPSAADRSLLQAARAGVWTEVVLLLKQPGVAANATDERGASALALAARAGAEEAVRALIRQGADLERRGEAGLSPLASAVIGGHSGTVRLLVQAGADTLAPGGAPQPPLHWAAQLNLVGVVDTLLALGVSPHATNARGQDALYVAFVAQRHDALARLSAAASRRP